MDNNNPDDFDERGAGGNGGQGAARGTGQQRSWWCGHHGAAIAKGGYNITSISGGGRIYGVHNNVAPT